MMNIQIYIDRLLENENLTAALEDTEANWLLQWGITQIYIVTDGILEDEIGAEKVSALMAFMRRVSRTVARKNHRTLEELLEALHELEKRYAQAFGRCRQFTPVEYNQTAAHIQAISTMEALQFLVEWFAPESPI